MEILTILWREWIFFKRRFWKITATQIVSPILYLITFGLGMGQNVTMEGQPYLYYILPGIIAMTTMRASYSAVSMRISITRLHEKSFESYLYSPTRLPYLTLGYIIAGALRGMYSGFIIMPIALIGGVHIKFSILLIFIMFMNGLIFASIGFIAAMTINTHYDLNRFNSFVINPMSFLCGTLFSVSRMPFILREFIELFPLTHTSRLLRAISFDYNISGFSVLIIVVYMVMLYIISVRVCYQH